MHPVPGNRLLHALPGPLVEKIADVPAPKNPERRGKPLLPQFQQTRQRTAQQRRRVQALRRQNMNPRPRLVFPIRRLRDQPQMREGGEQAADPRRGELQFARQFAHARRLLPHRNHLQTSESVDKAVVGLNGFFGGHEITSVTEFPRNPYRFYVAI